MAVKVNVEFNRSVDRRHFGGKEIDSLLNELQTRFRDRLSGATFKKEVLTPFANRAKELAQIAAPIGESTNLWKGIGYDIQSSRGESTIKFFTNASRRTKRGGNAPYGWYQELGYRTYLPKAWKLGNLRRGVSAVYSRKGKLPRNHALSEKETKTVARASGSKKPFSERSIKQQKITQFWEGRKDIRGVKGIWGKEPTSYENKKYFINLRSRMAVQTQRQEDPTKKGGITTTRKKVRIFMGGTQLHLKKKRHDKAAKQERHVWWHKASNNDTGYLRKSVKKASDKLEEGIVKEINSLLRK